PSGLGAATTLVVDDATAIAREVNGVKRQSPIVKLRAWTAGDEGRLYAPIVGGGAAFGEIYAWSYSSGRFFTDDDVTARTPVAVLGASVRDGLFGDSVNPVGRTVTIRNRAFKIVGVTRSADEEQAESLFVPYTALQHLIGITHVQGITIEATQSGDATRTASDVTTLLRRRHARQIDAAGAAVARLRHAGILGNQMPQAGGAGTP